VRGKREEKGQVGGKKRAVLGISDSEVADLIGGGGRKGTLSIKKGARMQEVVA